MASDGLDVIILLGGRNDEAGRLTAMTKSRADGALEAYRSTRDAKLILNGGFGHFNATSKTHASYLARYLQKCGVLESDILALLESTNTVEEAVFSARFLAPYSVKSARVVTSETHLPRVKLIFEHFFSPSSLKFVETPDAVPADELVRWQGREKQKLQRLHDQGGVIVDEVLHRRKA